MSPEVRRLSGDEDDRARLATRIKRGITVEVRNGDYWDERYVVAVFDAGVLVVASAAGGPHVPQYVPFANVRFGV